MNQEALPIAFLCTILYASCMDEQLPSISGGDLNGLWDEEATLKGRLVRRPIKTFDREQMLRDIVEVFYQIGGVPRFSQWAHEYPTQFFTKILPKTLPQQAPISANIGSLNITYLAAIPPSPLDATPPPPIDAEFTENDDDEPSS